MNRGKLCPVQTTGEGPAWAEALQARSRNELEENGDENGGWSFLPPATGPGSPLISSDVT